jgi:hypothetical protein
MSKPGFADALANSKMIQLSERRSASGGNHRRTILQMKSALRPMFEVGCQISHFEKARGRQHIIAELRRRGHEQLCRHGKIHRAKGGSRPLRIPGGHHGVGAEIQKRLDRMRSV